MKLGQVFDPRNNALNAWRLVLATGVFVGHSFALTGNEDELLAPVGQLLSQVWVDGFFAISGFLVTGSWLRNPQVKTYLAARALRLLPGLWFCLLLTGFVIAPVAIAVQHGPNILATIAPLKYFLMNFTTVTLEGDIGGTPKGVPYPDMWNGSLWTLQFEVLCYIAVMAFGLMGLLRRQWFLPAVTVLALIWSVLLPPWVLGEPVSIAQILARFTLMFFAGALLHQFRDVVPARWSLVGISVGIVLTASLLPNYRLLAAIPLAYLLIASGAMVKNGHLRFRNDLSYGVYIYAWPLQQLLVMCGLGTMNPLLFTVVVAAPILALATLSWFVVEKRALSLKSRLHRQSRPQSSMLTLRDDGTEPASKS